MTDNGLARLLALTSNDQKECEDDNDAAHHAAILPALFARLLEHLLDALGVLGREIAELHADVEPAVAQFVLVDHPAVGRDHAAFDRDQKLETRSDADAVV